MHIQFLPIPSLLAFLQLSVVVVNKLVCDAALRLTSKNGNKLVEVIFMSSQL